MCASDISILLQLQRILSFPLHSFDVWNVSDFSVPVNLFFTLSGMDKKLQTLELFA